MTAAAIIVQAVAAGCTLTPEGDRLRLAGTKPPLDLLEAIRTNKAAIIVHLTAIIPPVPATRHPAELEPSERFTATSRLSTPHVKCNQCRNSDNDGHGDLVMGWLLCHADGPGGWGNVLRACPQFIPRVTQNPVLSSRAA